MYLLYGIKCDIKCNIRINDGFMTYQSLYVLGKWLRVLRAVGSTYRGAGLCPAPCKLMSY